MSDLSEALELIRTSEAIDIHVESFVWTRLLHYHLADRHGSGRLGGRYYSQFDLPRMREVGMAGAVLSVATNPARRDGRRTATLAANLTRLRAEVEAAGGTVVDGLASWRAARAAGRTACFLAVQGGNAFDSPDDVTGLTVSRVTLVHLTNSPVGATSSPLGRAAAKRPGLTAQGQALVEALNQHRVLVDLAHISRSGFWAALAAHDHHVPPIVSHTGLAGVRPSWRNIGDDQVRAMAERGGVVGVMYHNGFLARPARSATAETVVRHLEHAIAVGGEEVAALGSDWDGVISPPRDFRTVSDLGVLVGAMLHRGWREDRIRRVLGANYLRVVEAVRPAS